MKRSRIAALACLIAPLLAAQRAWAGDPQAHAAAAQAATNKLAEEKEFAKGVGAPMVGIDYVDGRFTLPVAGVGPCAYDELPYGQGCAYEHTAGAYVNEPDDWGCDDSRQPPAINAANWVYSPAQQYINSGLLFIKGKSDKGSLMCNWTHFVANPAITSIANSNSSSAIRTTTEWATALLSGIEKDGATEDAACNDATFDTYLERTYSAMHFAQDAVVEHHAWGNMVCSNADIASNMLNAGLYNFSLGADCMKWMRETYANVTGIAPQYQCDDRIVSRETEPTITFSTELGQMLPLCGRQSDGSWLAEPLVPLACMGLERVIRHHCSLDVPKSLTCYGPATDHQGVSDARTYCEGEYYSGGGQDFFKEATDVSVTLMRDALTAWATVCKEPDDPCDATQCTNWCQRTIGKEQYGYPMRGYCTNLDDGEATPDEHCVMHHCVCASEIDCGASGQQCCQQGAACKNDGDECGTSTGTCVPKNTGRCIQDFNVAYDYVPGNFPTDDDIAVSAHIVEPLPPDTDVVWSWSSTGVGSLELSTTDGDQPVSVSTFHTGSAEGSVTFTVSARVTPPGKSPVSIVPLVTTGYVRKGLTTIEFEANQGYFACTDPLACGVGAYTAFIVPRFAKATKYAADLSGYTYLSCNRQVEWVTTKGDGGGCNFPVTYHPHNSAGPTNQWAVWTGWPSQPWSPGPEKCHVTVTLAP